jgi:hypothetical protein
MAGSSWRRPGSSEFLFRIGIACVTMTNGAYRYNHPKLTKKEVEDVIDSYKAMKWWP